MQAVLLLVIGALVSLLVTVLLTDVLQSTVVRLFGPLAVRRGRNINGLWFTLYLVTRETASSLSAASAGRRVEELTLYKVGDHVVGRSLVNNRYRLRGSLAGHKFLTGTWEEFSEGRYQWGSFQLCWNDDGSTMGGKFLGKDSVNHINHGIWLWARTTEELLPLARRMNQRGGYSFDIEAVTTILAN